MPPHQKSKPPSSGKQSTNKLDPAHDDESLTKGGDNLEIEDGMLEVQSTHHYFVRCCARKNGIIDQDSDSLALIPKTDEAQTGKETFPFLTLPPEVRNKIYRDDAFRHCNDAVFLPFGDKYTLSGLLWQPPIARVNKQIRNESLSIIYGECHFIYDFPEPDDFDTSANFLDPYHQVYDVLRRFTPNARTGGAQLSPGISRVKSGDGSRNESTSAGILEPKGLLSPSTLRFLTILQVTVECPGIDEDRIDSSDSFFDWLFRPETVGFRMCSAIGAWHYSNRWAPKCQRRLSDEGIDWGDPATVDEEYSRCIGKLEYGDQVPLMRDRYHLYKSPADLPSSGLPLDVDVMCSIARHCPELTNSVWAVVV